MAANQDGRPSDVIQIISQKEGAEPGTRAQTQSSHFPLLRHNCPRHCGHRGSFCHGSTASSQRQQWRPRPRLASRSLPLSPSRGPHLLPTRAGVRGHACRMFAVKGSSGVAVRTVATRGPQHSTIATGYETLTIIHFRWTQILKRKKRNIFGAVSVLMRAPSV